MTFPAPPHSFPTKDEMGNFLEALRANVQTAGADPARASNACRVTVMGSRHRRQSTLRGARTSSSPWRTISARACRRSRTNSTRASSRSIPSTTATLRSSATATSSSSARATPGPRSRAKLSRAHTTWMSGRDVGHVPFDIDGLAARLLLFRLVLRVLFHRILTVATPLAARCARRCSTIGGAARANEAEGSRPLPASGASRASPAPGTACQFSMTAASSTSTNVVWCTGFHPGFSWLDLAGLRSQRRSRARARHRD